MALKKKACSNLAIRYLFLLITASKKQHVLLAWKETVDFLYGVIELLLKYFNTLEKIRFSSNVILNFSPFSRLRDLDESLARLTHHATRCAIFLLARMGLFLCPGYIGKYPKVESDLTFQLYFIIIYDEVHWSTSLGVCINTICHDRRDGTID